MKDIYRELLVRSMEDCATEAENLEDEYGIQIPPQMITQMAMSLFKFRVYERMGTGMADDREIEVQ